MNTRLTRFFLSMAMLAGMSIPAALATSSNDYELGCQNYSKGDYQTALSYLLKTASTYPQNATVHYQLANTFVQLNRRTEARDEYSRCLSSNPDPTTAVYSRKMLDLLKGTVSNRVATVAHNGRPVQCFRGEGVDAQRRAEQTKVLRQRQMTIIRTAEQEAQAVIAEARQQVEELWQNGNWTVRNVETGEVTVGAPSSVTKPILNAAQARAREIREQAYYRANHL